MNEIEFDVELTVRELYGFSMRHTYTAISGVFGLIISIGSWIICAIRFGELDQSARIALLIIGCLFTIIQPIMLYSKARAQIRRNKNINARMHYMLDEEGICVSMGEQEAEVKWQDVRKKVQAKHSIYLYMSPIRAFIFPESQCDGQFARIDEMIDKQMDKYKDYVEPEVAEEGERTEDDHRE